MLVLALLGAAPLLLQKLRGCGSAQTALLQQGGKGASSMVPQPTRPHNFRGWTTAEAGAVAAAPIAGTQGPNGSVLQPTGGASNVSTKPRTP
eukprot:1161233-Pelagomonas_calceolata.AAC.2